jgi:uncharacterized protein YbjT (DUF2867 family)
MRVAIAGGHGQIALRLTRLLHDRGDEVTSLVRNEDHFDDVWEAGGEPVLCDLESASAGKVVQALDSVDAIVFAAGAGPGSGSARKETMDFGGAVKLIDAAKINGIDRYVMVSSTGANANAEGDDTFAAYLRAKGKADDALIASGLDYTVIRPTGLTDDPGDGLVHIAERVKRGKVPRDDVAAVIAAALQEPATSGRVFGVADGDQPIDEAIRSL